MNNKLWWLLFFFVTMAGIVFAEMRQYNLLCQGLVVILDKKAEYPFFNEQDIKTLADGEEQLQNTLLRTIDLKTIEKRVMNNRLIKNCQVSRDLSGHLIISVEQQQPIARLINLPTDDGVVYAGGRYLTDTGAVIPISGRFTARTLLIFGTFFRNLKNLNTKNGKKLIELLNEINKDTFWKAQLSEMQVDEAGEINIIPQVGNHTIEFGTADGYVEKLKKLKIFYKKVLPIQTWEKYKKVSVKFRNQIVCQ
jgi:cell division protein FtsQ